MGAAKVMLSSFQRIIIEITWEQCGEKGGLRSVGGCALSKHQRDTQIHPRNPKPTQLRGSDTVNPLDTSRYTPHPCEETTPDLHWQISTVWVSHPSPFLEPAASQKEMTKDQLNFQSVSDTKPNEEERQIILTWSWLSPPGRNFCTSASCEKFCFWWDWFLVGLMGGEGRETSLGWWGVCLWGTLTIVR